MAEIKKDGFGYLGIDFQYRLIHQFLVDRKFTEKIITIVDANYFEDESLRLVVSTIKNSYEKFEAVPDIESLKMRLLEHINDDIKRNFILSQIKRIVESESNDALYIQELSMKFCKQQELNKSIKAIQKIVDRGNLEDYDTCAELIRKALEVGNNVDDDTSVYDDIDSALADDYRQPVPTGILGLDGYMNGGLGRGELGIILAPFGVGKTTMMTKIANTAVDEGYNVLQIFFEDMPNIIKRKHLSCWSGIKLNDLNQHKDFLKNLIKEKSLGKGSLKLKKFSSDGTTIPMIRQYVKRKIAQGFRPDVILLDYIDCVQPSKSYDDANVAEGNIMRQFETLIADFDMVGWTAVQGNRSSIKSEVVEADQIGGSIKKGQIGHFIVSIAKSLEQKENHTATMAILKSRFGDDGIVFNDVMFDNSTIQIDISENNKGQSFLGKVETDAANRQATINNVLEAAQKRKKELQDKKDAEAAKIAKDNNVVVNETT